MWDWLRALLGLHALPPLPDIPLRRPTVDLQTYYREMDHIDAQLLALRKEVQSMIRQKDG